jgi:hypothetical protein
MSFTENLGRSYASIVTSGTTADVENAVDPITGRGELQTMLRAVNRQSAQRFDLAA